MNRNTAIKLSEYKNFGGSFHDSVSHASMFRDYKPYNFGVKTAQLFSSSLKSELVNKKFNWMTIASGNYHVLPGGVDDYEWSVAGDAKVEFRITELLVDPTSQPGKDGQPFKIAIDKNFEHEPSVLLTEDPDAPMLRIIGYPEMLNADSWAYEVELQSGDPNDWMPIELISPDRILTRATSMVADEDNQKFSPDSYGQFQKLRSWTGQFANKIEFTDKFVRMELAAAKKGMANTEKYSFGGKMYSDAFASGYIYQAKLKQSGSNELIEKGVFITKAEARLNERCEADREFMMEFGRLQKTTDRDTTRPIKVAPGWRQLARDGHFWEHNGSLTLSDLSEFLTTIFFRRKSFADRKIKIYSGEGGIEFLSRLIAEEASAFNYPDANFFVKQRQNPDGYHDNELSFGAQFTEIKFYNGVTVSINYDPIKDDDSVFRIKAPGTNKPLESFAMDIFDLGATDYKAEGARDENITMVMQDGVEEYFSVCNRYDIRSGAITDGSNAYSNNSRCGVYRVCAGSLAIWDISRVGRIEYNPYM